MERKKEASVRFVESHKDFVWSIKDKEYKVLAIANSNAIEEKRDKYPILVVYHDLTALDKVWTRPILDFLTNTRINRRMFSSPTLEDRKFDILREMTVLLAKCQIKFSEKPTMELSETIRMLSLDIEFWTNSDDSNIEGIIETLRKSIDDERYR